MQLPAIAERGWGAVGRVDRRASHIRWRARSGSVDPPLLEPFGASVDSIFTASNGVGIAGSGAAGWDFGTDDEADGGVFRYRITTAAFSRP